jgi:hypothetical protein
MTSLITRMKTRIKELLSASSEYLQAPSVKQPLLRQEMAALRELMRDATPDNPALAGYKMYSQTDEDGIIAEIFRRIGEGNRTFFEIGCGNGTENNTHALLLAGWRGTWVDASTAHIDSIARWIPLETPILRVLKTKVTRENVSSIIGANDVDFLSIDIDGNDLHVLQQIVSTAKPRVIATEYNGKFPPPLAITIDYNATHSWGRDDYHGASIQAFVDGLPGYRLVCCNLSGANAFFVRNDEASAFIEYPVSALYQPARTHLIQWRVGPAPSLKFLRDLIQRSVT